MRTDYIRRAQRFIHMVEPFLREGGLSSPSNAKRAVEAFNRRNSRHVRLEHGLTRLVFVASDYVVKVDYGEWQMTFGGCENEVHIYALAKRDGMEHMFAPITRYDYNGISWYIMPRVKGIGRYDDDAYNVVDWDEAEWLELHLNDLHNLNYGWGRHGIVIFDYACETMEALCGE
jgi:hypothetical protein